MNKFNYSIIIPHKNSPDLLQRCINSIPKRNDVQIIIVDDNSDSTKVDFEHFPGVNEKSTEIYFTKEGKGAGYARNVGLKHVKGKWVLFADADDYYASNFLDILDKNLSEEIDILYFNVFSNDDKKFNRATDINSIYALYAENQNINIIKYKIWAPWNKVISHCHIQKYNLQFDEIPVGNDAIFSLKANILTERTKVINDKLYCLTYQTDSITYRPMTFERKLAYAYINLRINKFFKDNNLFDYQITIISPKMIVQLLKEYGAKGTLNFLKYITENNKLSELLYIWFRRKYILKTVD